MENENFISKRFTNIQALRGITAVFIVLEHIRFLNCGAFGVDIFFCISGFMIMFSTEKSTSHFLGKRFLRIVPLYACMTMGTYLMLLVAPGLFALTKPDPIYLLKSLLFIPFEISDGIIQPLLRIGWTVNCEVFFYLLFFIAMRISFKYRGLIVSLLLALPIILNTLLTNPPVFLRFYGDYVMVEFVYGILLYTCIRWLYSKKDRMKHFLPWISYLSLAIATVLFLMLAITKKQTNILAYRRPLVWGIPAAVIVFCFFICEFYIELPQIIAYLGNISFSVYLIHYYPVQFLDRKIFHFDQCTLSTCLGAVLSVAISMILGAFLYEFIEKRLIGKISKKIFTQ